MKKLKIAIIADDLTGASDCGGQLVHYGIPVSVKIDPNFTENSVNGAIVLNTDSRSLPAAKAKMIVKTISEHVSRHDFDVIYKKIDSTMRGNIGAELNAMYDVFKPDFVMIAPGYPENGRQVINGIHYVNGTKLHETEAARDPKTPVAESDIHKLIEKQTGRKSGHLTYEDIQKGSGYVHKKLAGFRQNGISYVTADSVHRSDMEAIVRMLADMPFSVIWAGSAGLMNALPKAFNLEAKNARQSVPSIKEPIMFVAGSISRAGRKQLHTLLASGLAEKIEMRSDRVIAGGVMKRNEFTRLKAAAVEALRASKNIALFSSDNPDETRESGRRLGLTPLQTSDRVSHALGELAGELIQHLAVKRLFLTGGDTAYQVLHQLNVAEFRLLDEVEPGIPLGIANPDVFIVTKAGNFGSESAMVKAAIKLQGG
ncbi:four-carbon acid sugar kinase family protein [Bacillus atrophaeus]|uniref:four-carbon acid sugar kinase family protein n=1 Tax=Bacillus atrophaeus TaxID=1452 RepID=UPI002281415C|nr:four-carbon acid sugar kinase family protein [Bacillus atrophaeus]MCY8516768.1 hypothetical protein [Bacillus atrophaeus]